MYVCIFDTTKYTERYKSEFEFIKRGKDEGLHELANRVRRLVSLAYPNIEAKFRDELPLISFWMLLILASFD